MTRLAAAYPTLLSFLLAFLTVFVRELMPGSRVHHDLDRLHQNAIALRPELQVRLSALRRDRQDVKLARLRYYRDLVAILTWNEVADHGLSPVAAVHFSGCATSSNNSWLPTPTRSNTICPDASARSTTMGRWSPCN